MNTESLDLSLTATTPIELREAQVGLIEWCSKKITSVTQEAAELTEEVIIATRRKWKISTLKRHESLAKKRLTYYEKIKAALEAGYYIVPTFPVSVFAIRTDKTKPARMYRVTESKWGDPGGDFGQEAPGLPVGVGEYKPKSPIVETNKLAVDDLKKASEGVKNWEKFTVGWGDIEFPINMAKPVVMEATEKAMQALVFDELGILPNPKPKQDPLIVGRILGPKTSPYYSDRRVVTFMIAWHLNVRDL